MSQYQSDYDLQEKDNVIELIPKLKIDIIKMIYESLGINLGKTENKINYYNYSINNPEAYGNSFGFGLDESIDLSNYNGKLISINDLMKIYPHAKREYAHAAIYALDQYGDKVGLTNKGKMMVLAQFAHESGNFIYTYELGRGNGKSYGNPSGPYGKRYYGRGPIQITWESNYKYITEKCFPLIGLNNVNIHADPDLCERNLVVGCVASLCWFMIPGNGKKAVSAANNGDIVALTKAINGGTNGLEDRINNTKKIFSFVSNA